MHSLYSTTFLTMPINSDDINVCVTHLMLRRNKEERCVFIMVKQHMDDSMLTVTTYLQPVDQFFLYGVLSCSISGYT